MANPRKSPSRLVKKPSGHYALYSALWRFREKHQEEWLDSLGAIGEALREWRAAIVADLGGEESLSAMERATVDIIVRSHLLLSSVDQYLLGLPCPVNRQKHQLFAVVLQRDTLANSICRNLERLGLSRRAKAVPTLAELLAERDAQVATKTEAADATAIEASEANA
jgi:hypothetical protein